MLWIPAARKTRSGRIFAEFFESPVFNIHGPLSAAVLAESDQQVDSEPHDAEPDPEATRNDIADAGLHPPTQKRKATTVPLVIEDMPKRPRGPPSSHAHRSRKKKRMAKVAAEGHEARPAAYAKHAVGVSLVQTGLNLDDLSVEHGAYRARMADKQEARGAKKRWGLEELQRLGFRRIQWNGIDGIPFIDATGRTFAVLAGRPDTKSYNATVARAYDLLVRATAIQAATTSSRASHRRGLYAVVTVGISYGQGQTSACALNADYPDLGKQLVEDEAFQEIASFGSAMLSFWAPNLYRYYRDCNRRLDPKLQQPRPFKRSVFAAATFNLGPNVWTFKHRDVLNLPFGWCAITALGDFDPTKGGHLVLWDLKLVIEFPPGSTILIPSATLTHSNIPVSKDEYRASFTQYTAGGLFRYVDNEFQRKLSWRYPIPPGMPRFWSSRKNVGRWV